MRPITNIVPEEIADTFREQIDSDLLAYLMIGERVSNFHVEEDIHGEIIQEIETTQNRTIRKDGHGITMTQTIRQRTHRMADGRNFYVKQHFGATLQEMILAKTLTALPFLSEDDYLLIFDIARNCETSEQILKEFYKSKNKNVPVPTGRRIRLL